MRRTRDELRDMSSAIDNLMDLGRRADAEQLLLVALEESAHDPAYHLFFQAESALYIDRDHRQREHLLTRGLQSAPEDPFLLRNLGGGYLIEEKYGKARRLFNRALEIDPKNADTLRSFGLLHSAKGKESRAICWFQKALAVKPDDYDSLRQIGVCHAKLGNDREAINWYGRALGCNPRDYDAMRQTGISHAMLGDYETALRWLDRAIATNPDDRESKRNKNLVLMKQSGRGRTFLDAIMIRIVRFFTLAWRRIVDRIDQAFHQSG